MFHRFYDDIFARKDYRGEIERVLRLARAGPVPLRILEIGSGTGNHSQVCAALGHTVAGVETDAAMVAQANAKRQRLPADVAGRITYFAGAVEDLPNKQPFDVALAMFNVVTYLPTIAVLESFMHAIAERLPAGASFIFDAWNGVAALRDPPGGKQTRIETPTHVITTTLTSCTNALALCTTLHYDIEARSLADGCIEHGTYEFAQTLWPPKVLTDVLVARGFTLVDLHPLDDFTRQATAADWKVLFHARRAAVASPV